MRNKTGSVWAQDGKFRQFLGGGTCASQVESPEFGSPLLRVVSFSEPLPRFVMPGRPRKDVIREDQVGVYHVWTRCAPRSVVRLRSRHAQELQSSKKVDLRAARRTSHIFAVDACVFSILSNHFHLLLRNRVDLAQQSSDEEVVRRWRQLCPERRDEQGNPAEPTATAPTNQ